MTSLSKWLGDSGNVVVVPNSGTLSAGIETLKKPAKQLRLCPAAGVAGVFFATANATTAIPPTFEALAGRGNTNV